MLHPPTGRGWSTLRRRRTLSTLVSLITNNDISGKKIVWRMLWLIIDLFGSAATDPWSSESSGAYVTLQLIPEQSSLDWGELLEPGPDSEEFLRPPVHPTPAEKKVHPLLIFCYKVWNTEKC